MSRIQTAVEYLRSRIEKRFGVVDVVVRETTLAKGWEACVKCPPGAVTARGANPLEALEALEEHLARRAVLEGWARNGGLRGDDDGRDQGSAGRSSPAGAGGGGGGEGGG